MQESIAEELKAADQMQWVQRMKSVHDRATEIVKKDLIFHL